MPNHCTNNLSCTSGKNIGEVIKPYISERKEDNYNASHLDFNKIIPMPKCILESLEFGNIDYITSKRTEEEQEIENKKKEEIADRCMKETGHADWYNWCVAVWDTKWNSYNNVTLDDLGCDGRTIEDLDILCFQTAWSPPINVIRELSKLTGESLRMSYYDEGWMFGGVFEVSPEGGEVDQCYDDINDCPEDLKEELDVQYYLDCMNEDDEDEEEEEEVV